MRGYLSCPAGTTAPPLPSRIPPLPCVKLSHFRRAPVFTQIKSMEASLCAVYFTPAISLCPTGFTSRFFMDHQGPPANSLKTQPSETPVLLPRTGPPSSHHGAVLPFVTLGTQHLIQLTAPQHLVGDSVVVFTQMEYVSISYNLSEFSWWGNFL